MKTHTTLPRLAMVVISCSIASVIQAAPDQTAKQAPAKKQPQKKQPAKKTPAKAETIPMCPKCNMQMVKTSSLLKRHPVKVNGKTYYCCTVCPKH